LANRDARFRKSTLISLLSDDYVQIGHELTSCKAVGSPYIRRYS
jgi:hypothetical protein